MTRRSDTLLEEQSTRSQSPRARVPSYLTAPHKFARIFTRTSHYLRKANRVHKKQGGISKTEMQGFMKSWAREVLDIINVEVEIRGEVPHDTTPALFVGNHVSYTDIPLLMASVPIVFVSKEEISRWLVIGAASKRAGTVFVKRESGPSRARTMESIANCIIRDRQSVAIFPSGTTTLDESKPWRNGVFKLAHQNNIPVQPFRITYKPLRIMAYIDKDFFPTHLWNLLASGKRCKAVIEFGAVQTITDPTADCESLWKWSQDAHDRGHKS